MSSGSIWTSFILFHDAKHLLEPVVAKSRGPDHNKTLSCIRENYKQTKLEWILRDPPPRPLPNFVIYLVSILKKSTFVLDILLKFLPCICMIRALSVDLYPYCLFLKSRVFFLNLCSGCVLDMLEFCHLKKILSEVFGRTKLDKKWI